MKLYFTWIGFSRGCCSVQNLWEQKYNFTISYKKHENCFQM